jgi:hypothetical protein
MAAMHGISLNTLTSMELQLTGFSETAVRAYGEAMLDQIFTNSDIKI